MHGIQALETLTLAVQAGISLSSDYMPGNIMAFNYTCDQFGDEILQIGNLTASDPYSQDIEFQVYSLVFSLSPECFMSNDTFSNDLFGNRSIEFMNLVFYCFFTMTRYP